MSISIDKKFQPEENPYADCSNKQLLDYILLLKKTNEQTAHFGETLSLRLDKKGKIKKRIIS